MAGLGGGSSIVPGGKTAGRVASGIGEIPGRVPVKAAPIKAAPVPSTAVKAAPSPVDYSAILQAFGPSSQTGPSSPASAPAPMVNTSTPNPTITAVNQAQIKDFQGDMNAGNLSRQSDIEIRDAAENERKAARQNAAARGVSSGGVEDIQQAGITSAVLANQTKARVGLKNEGEMRRAALGGQIAGQAAVDENLQNQQRNTGINQQSMQFQHEQALRDADLARFRTVLDMFGGGSLFS